MFPESLFLSDFPTYTLLSLYFITEDTVRYHTFQFSPVKIQTEVTDFLNLFSLKYNVSKSLRMDPRLHRCFRQNTLGFSRTTTLAVSRIKVLCSQPFKMHWLVHGGLTLCLTINNPHISHTMHLCVQYDSHSKQQLFPHTTLIGAFLQW